MEDQNAYMRLRIQTIAHRLLLPFFPQVDNFNRPLFCLIPTCVSGALQASPLGGSTSNTGRAIPATRIREGQAQQPTNNTSDRGYSLPRRSQVDTIHKMADEQPRHSVEVMDPIPESRAASPMQPEPTHPPFRREGGMGLPSVLRRTGTMPTTRDNDAEQNQSSNRGRGISMSNSLHPVSTNGSRGRPGSVSSSRQRKSVKMERTPTGFAGLGMRKRTTTWNLNGPTALGRQGTGLRRRGTLNLGGVSSAVHVGGDSQSAAGFTLAGPGNPLDTIIANQPYIDPGYVDLNPAYEVAPNARPVWGLAKPLPHVVRQGMIPTKTEVLEQTPSQMRHEKKAEEEFDLEAGRVESTINPHKISSALQAAQQDREFRLLRTYTGQSAFGRHGRRRSSVSSAQLARPSVASERQHGRADRHDSDQSSQSQVHTVKKLDAVAEQQTPDENNHPNEKGWIMEDTLAVTPVQEDKMEDDWIEDPDDLKPYDPELDEIHNLHTHWSVIRLQFREPLAELLAVRSAPPPLSWEDKKKEREPRKEHWFRSSSLAAIFN